MKSKNNLDAFFEEKKKPRKIVTLKIIHADKQIFFFFFFFSGEGEYAFNLVSNWARTFAITK